MCDDVLNQELIPDLQRKFIYFILFYFILFYFILFYFILFYFIILFSLKLNCKSNVNFNIACGSEISSRRQLFEEYARANGFDALLPDNWYLQSREDIMLVKVYHFFLLFLFIAFLRFSFLSSLSSD